MRILTTPTFDRTTKKLHKNLKVALDKAVRLLANDPTLGEAKKGDLKGVYVYKFNALNREYLLAYIIISKGEIKLLMFGNHENFYRDIKK
jgi:mRNA-degrading endonuclease RelE of RelBE toxin-antitoxin system